MPEHLVAYMPPALPDPPPTASRAALDRWEDLHRDHYNAWIADRQRWLEEHDAGGMAEAIAIVDEVFEAAPNM